jgi:hypothetical protein
MAVANIDHAPTKMMRTSASFGEPRNLRVGRQSRPIT